MDRIRPIRPPGSPHVLLSSNSALAFRLLRKAVAGRNACLIWTGHVDRDGYGRATGGGKRGYAHRFAYEALVDAIPTGMQIDHVCHSTDSACAGGSDCLHRRCINPGHLEAVTPRENSIRANSSFVSINARKTHCKNGHPFEPGNTYIRSNGSRKCQACQRASEQRYRAKRQVGVR